MTCLNCCILLLTMINHSFITKPLTHSHKPTHLHPEEHALAAGLELEDVDPAGGAGRHVHELAVVGEDGQVLLYGAGATVLENRDQIVNILPN